MNKKQMMVIWITLVVLFIMCLFPMRVTTSGNELKRGFAFTQKLKLSHERTAQYSRIDAGTTFGQMLPVVIFGTGLLFAFKDKTNNK